MGTKLRHAFGLLCGPLAARWVVGAAFAGATLGCGKVAPKKSDEKNLGQAPATPIVTEGEAETFGNGQSLDSGNDQCGHVGRPHELKINLSGFTKVTWSRVAGPGTCAFADPTRMETSVTCDAVGDHRITVTATSDSGKFFTDSIVLRMRASSGVGGLDNCTGTVTTMLGQVDDSPMAVAVQPDGRIVIAGYSHSGKDRDFAIVRYNANGTLDRSFAQDGKLVEDIVGMDTVKDVKIQSDGRIVVAGDSSSGTGSLAFALARYEANGKPDFTFNVTGKQGTAFAFGDAYGNALLLQQDGKMLVGGEVYNATQQFDFGIVRVNPNGELDTTFATSGRVIADLSRGSDGIHAMALQTDGKIVAAGYSTAPGSLYQFAIARFNPDGTLDTTFGTNGRVNVRNGTSHSTAHAVAIQSDGKIVVVGDYMNGATRDLAIVRLTTAGVVDTSFGGGGSTLIGFGTTMESRQDVVIQDDDKIVVVGSGIVKGTSAFVALRLNSNGSIDTGFGTNGATVLSFEQGPDFGRAVAIDLKGDIIVTGSTGSPSGFGWFRLFR